MIQIKEFSIRFRPLNIYLITFLSLSLLVWLSHSIFHFDFATHISSIRTVQSTFVLSGRTMQSLFPNFGQHWENYQASFETLCVR